MEQQVADIETSTPTAAAASAAPTWDLSDLYASIEDPALEIDLNSAQDDAADLENSLKGRLETLTGDELAETLDRYGKLQDRIGRAYSFAQLCAAADRNDPVIGRFFQSVQEKVNAITTRLLFITLELNHVEDAVIEAKINESRSLAGYRPWLRDVRAFRPHQLSDDIERILHEKSVAGRNAWVRLFDESMAGVRFPHEDRELTATQIFDLLSDPDRSKRQAAGASIAQTLQGNIRLLARITNTLIKDKEVEDRWRHFERPISARNLANQVEDNVVETLISTVRAAYPRTSHRYYALKARWMGLEKLAYWDRNAPLPEDKDTRHGWNDAKSTVLQAYADFSPDLSGLVDRFFVNDWIDAELRPNKDSGAFCHPTVTSAHPYILMNFQGRNRDVMTLAHELGHGVHQLLAARQGPLMAGTPLTLAETASVFGEQLTFRALLAAERDPVAKRILLANKIEDMLNTVVRQIAFCEFERRVHDQRRKAELTPDDLSAIWLEVQRESLGPAFDFDEGYGVYWSYIPHFVHAPFYVYAYAFGDCLVNSLYAVYEANPQGFEAKYLEMLAAGGTLRHQELLAPFGLDATDPEFWQRGLGILEGFIDALDAELGELT